MTRTRGAGNHDCAEQPATRQGGSYGLRGKGRGRMSMTIKEFCRMHRACSEGRIWAIETGEPGMAELWKREDIKPAWRIWIATRPGVLTDRELRLFACWCCRHQVWHLLTDELSRHTVEIAELYAEGKATSDELAAAEDAARDAAWTRAGAAEETAARAAEGAAVRDAAEAAAWTAEDAALAAALDAAGDAAWDAARAAQAAYLKQHAHPSF